MNFRELENIENQFASADATISDNLQLAMEEYLEKKKEEQKQKQDITANPFVCFYEDVIANPMSFNFQPVLGEAIYKNASDDALSCLKICDNFNKLSSWSVIGWLPNALKFVDNIVLHYIQDLCKEIPKSYSNAGIEKARYIQLSEKTGDISVAGATLKNLYDVRNKLEHRTKIFPDGKQELIRPQRNKVR
ncbi:MAG: hypothetical protein LBR10_15060, partial [Prevotellaceae bacterium]|nr:hypothetical protein [Prevotellaceae bacterium]